jgi:hypothetical protein
MHRRKSIIRPTATRVEENTAPPVKRDIEHFTEGHLAQAASDPQRITTRLQELDEEWDIERVLQTNYGIVNLLSITLGALVARPWFLVTGFASAFMIQHAVQGWCPPVPVFRKFGFRTAREIDQERYALKALRGDFRGVDAQNPRKVTEVVTG